MKNKEEKEEEIALMELSPENVHQSKLKHEKLK
jgi:hypothetical protein